MQLRSPWNRKSAAIVGLALGSALWACSEDESSGTRRIRTDGGPPPTSFASLQLDPGVIDFADVQVGDSATANATLTHVRSGRSEKEVRILSVAPRPPIDDQLTFSIVAPQLLPENASIPISVTYTPTRPGDVMGALVINATSIDGETIEPIVLELSIRGRGVEASVTLEPSLVSFGNVVVDTTKTVDIFVRNNSSLDAVIALGAANNVRLCANSADPSTFCIQLRDASLRADNTFELLGNQTAILEARFTAAIAGVRERGSIDLRVCDEGPSCVVPVRFDALGVESGGRCDPTEIDFGQVNPGSCAALTVTCTNIANEDITVVSWRAGTGSSNDFTFEAPRLVLLEENDALDVEVTYCPQTLGDDEGLLVLETDGATPNIEIPLAGTGGGPDIAVFPEVLDFGLAALTAPVRRTILITNVGFSQMIITDISADTSGSGAFSFFLPPGVSLGTPLQPGEAIEITVEFQPQAVGSVESSLRISTNDTDEPDREVRLIGEGIDLPPCQFEVSPAQMTFGVVPRTGSLQRWFEIRNTGSNDCLITSARIEPGSDAEFTLPDGVVRSTFIAPNASVAIGVEFLPSAAATFTGAVEFSISNPNTPFNRVPLSGTGSDETLLLVPNELNYGVIGLGCAARDRTIQLLNSGTVPATINSITLVQPGSAFALRSVPTLPVNVPGGQSAEFDVGFQANGESDYAAAVEIQATFGGQPQTYIVSLRGQGDLDPTQTDTFSQLGTPKVDILFVIDHSSSMRDEQSAIANNFASFIQFAQAQAIDYQLGVTTTDSDAERGRLCPVSGNPANRIVTPNTMPDPRTVFANNVNCRSLAGGAPEDESGFEAAFQAFSAPVINGHNQGFLRRDAALSIVFVSDAAEQSPRSIDFYLNFFLSIKGFRNTSLFSASAITGPQSGPCQGPGGEASAAPRYVEAARRTGGVWQEICTRDWSRTLQQLSTTAFGFRTRFFLSNQPIISTLEVVVDGVTVPATAAGGTTNWTYDFATNSVAFAAAVTPAPGSEVRVEYTAECL